MPAGNIEIRAATAADAAELAAFARTSFRATYAPTHDPDRMLVHLATVLSDESFAAALGTDEFLVAIDGDRIVAFAQLRRAEAPARPEQSNGLPATSEIELRRFYVDHSLHGRGLAQRMFDAVVARAGAMNGHLLWLGVFPGNARAIAFYKRQGLVEIGRVTYNFVDLTEDDLALALNLHPESA